MAVSARLWYEIASERVDYTKIAVKVPVCYEQDRISCVAQVLSWGYDGLIVKSKT